MRKKQKTLQRTIEKEGKQALRVMKEWEGQAYACEEDANRAAERYKESQLNSLRWIFTPLFVGSRAPSSAAVVVHQRRQNRVSNLPIIA